MSKELQRTGREYKREVIYMNSDELARVASKKHHKSLAEKFLLRMREKGLVNQVRMSVIVEKSKNSEKQWLAIREFVIILYEDKTNSEKSFEDIEAAETTSSAIASASESESAVSDEYEYKEENWDTQWQEYLINLLKISRKRALDVNAKDKRESRMRRESSLKMCDTRNSNVCDIDLYEERHLKESCDNRIKNKDCRELFEISNMLFTDERIMQE